MAVQTVTRETKVDYSPSSAPVLSARVALVTDRWLKPEAWAARGMSVVRPGPAALEHLLAEGPDAIVLDLAIADFQQSASVWQIRDLLRVPLLVLAEGMGSAEVVSLLDRGADEVVTIPADPDVLAARVGAILRRREGRSRGGLPAVVCFSGAEVDMATRGVRRSDGSQTLSRTEFGLLQALVRAKGRACYHSELVGAVWGAESPSARQYLRLYIRYLRQKLERDPLQPCNILNVRGIGYRLTLGEQSGPPSSRAW